MGIRTLVVPVALMLALVGSAANAGQHGGGERRRGGGRDEGRVAAPREQAAPRQQAGPREAGPRVAEPRGGISQAPRVYESQAPRVYESRSRGYDGRSRVYEARPRVYEARPRVYVAPRGVRPYRYYYSRPYYVFRPRLSLGFGIWVGEPVPYPVYVPYPDPYGYSYPYPTYPSTYPQYPPQYPSSSYPPQPGTVAPAAVGGVSFDISPSDAAIWVDGQYVGVVGDFTATSQPLSLAPGRHHVEIAADGYIPMGFDVDVVAGQVIPYRGDLRQE